MSFPPSEYALREAVQNPALGALLPDYIRQRRWFGGKTRTITSARIADAVPMPANSPLAYLCFVQLAYQDGREDVYMLPLAFADGAHAAELRETMPQAVVADTDDLTGEGALYDATYDTGFCQLLLDTIGRGEHFSGAAGSVAGDPTAAFGQLRGTGELAPRISKAEQSNTSIIYGDRLILKLFRRIVPGLNPDLEIGRYLTEQGQFSQIAPVGGSLGYAVPGQEAATIGMLLGYVPNVGDAWGYTLELLDTLKNQIAAGSTPPAPPASASATPPAEVEQVFAGTLAAARQLGRRTAEMHLALAAPTSDPAFAPEPFESATAQSELQAMNALADRVFAEASERQPSQPEAVRAIVQQVLDSEPTIRERFAALVAQPLESQRARAHGDYHLGQVLATAEGDFVIIDFEGEPARTLAERRAKRSPLRDVAGMLRSFDYAAASVLTGDATLQAWAPVWTAWISAAYLQSYLQTMQASPALPTNRAEIDALLDAYLIEKAVYELQYELNNRPDWVRIPAQGILGLVR